jgi:hypothetical protein
MEAKSDFRLSLYPIWGLIFNEIFGHLKQKIYDYPINITRSPAQTFPSVSIEIPRSLS